MPQRRWFQMTPQQRQHHLSKVASALLTESSSTTVRITDFCYKELPEIEEPETQVLSLSVQDAGIESLPKPVVDGMWNKAKKLLTEPGQVMEGPGTSSSVTTCYVVGSTSSDRPHIVKRSSKSGQFLCEPSCAMWESSKICSHCVAAAQFSGNLEKFIEWYKASKSKPNLSKLAQVDMPKGTGRKGEKPPRKRKKSTSVYHTLIDNSTDTFEQEMATSSDSITPSSHAQSVEWNWSATPSHVTARTSFPPFNPWMYIVIHSLCQMIAVLFIVITFSVSYKFWSISFLWVLSLDRSSFCTSSSQFGCSSHCNYCSQFSWHKKFTGRFPSIFYSLYCRKYTHVPRMQE